MMTGGGGCTAAAMAPGCGQVPVAHDAETT